jgi:hypothetical protein
VFGHVGFLHWVVRHGPRMLKRAAIAVIIAALSLLERKT